MLLKVLVVDDSPVARHLVAKPLRSAGRDVIECATVADARRVDARALSCALLDLELDDEDGTRLAAELRAAHAELPLAFFTAATPDGELVGRARSLGPVFTKPTELASAVSWALAPR